MRRLSVLIFAVIGFAWLDGATTLYSQPIAPIARRLPPPGIEIPAADREGLQAGVTQLANRLEVAKPKYARFPDYPYLVDVEICLKAVQYALENNEYYDRREIKFAFDFLAEGERRLNAMLRERGDDWGSPLGNETKLAVLGYRSVVDGSVQPYGLVIPPQSAGGDLPLYVWLHGRGDKQTELTFMAQRQSKLAEFQPEKAYVLHVFGRHCNAFKFAGESDVFEAIRSLKKRNELDIDFNRIILCGFSMGGAGAWHLGAHHADWWTAVSPGAGFAETARYQNLLPSKYPAWYVQKLWGWYDAPNYVRNLFNVPVIAYSGEFDKQIQAARVMEEAYAAEGRKLPHLIGPGMGHKYHPDTLKELQGRLAKYADAKQPKEQTAFYLQTRTLRYNRAPGVEALGLDEHWQDSRVDVKLDRSAGTTKVITRNVNAFRLFGPATELHNGSLSIDGQDLSPKVFNEDLMLARIDGKWTPVRQYPLTEGLRKVHGLQGPIDDVFFEPFLVVTPSGKAAHREVQRWVDFELAHFKDRWRRIFRGDLRMKKDTEVTADDLKKYHVIAWGDPSSNSLLAETVDRLPIRWTKDVITVGDKSYPAAGTVVSMIYPNPLEPNRYLVVNSGPTFREGHDSTNSQQTPKLPDWAVIDLSEPPDALQPGKIADAGFFDEEWKYQAKRE